MSTINEYKGQLPSADEVKTWMSLYKPGNPIPDNIYQYYFSISDPAIKKALEVWNSI